AEARSPRFGGLARWRTLCLVALSRVRAAQNRFEEEHDEGSTVGPRDGSRRAPADRRLWDGIENAEADRMNARALGPVAACLLFGAASAYAGANDHTAPVARANPRDVIQVTGGALTVNVDRSPLSVVLDGIARQSGVSIRCDAPIAGTVTVNLRGVAVDEAFTRILGPRSAVFVYANNAATDRQPRLVEVRIYADQAAWSRSPATSPEIGRAHV